LASQGRNGDDVPQAARDVLKILVTGLEPLQFTLTVSVCESESLSPVGHVADDGPTVVCSAAVWTPVWLKSDAFRMKQRTLRPLVSVMLAGVQVVRHVVVESGRRGRDRWRGESRLGETP